MNTGKNPRAANFAEFARSFECDRRLFHADARVSLAYCDALFHAGILTRIESERIKNGLQTILKRADYYQDYFDDANAADVHAFIETKLVQLIGETGAKMNIGRSREDQSITAFRLWLREEIEAISTRVRDLQTALIAAGERQKTAIFPAYAYSRKASPILWAHWCLAYFEQFGRDRERLEETWRRVNVSPLGAADLTGTAFEIDREEVARALGFEGVSANSLDAAADADFAIETVGAFALLMMHVSRLAEDLILYSAPESGFVNFSNDANSVEIQNEITKILGTARGKTSEIFGYQATILTLLKNLPLGIHKDSQELKKTIFAAVDTVKNCLPIVTAAFENVRADEKAMLTAATHNYLNVAELTDYLVQRNVSIKTARATADKINVYAASQNKKFDDLSLQELQTFSETVGNDVFRALSLEQTLASKNQIGGTAPERVHEALEQARENLEREE